MVASPTYVSIALDLGTTSIKAGLLDRHSVLQHIVAQPVPPVAAESGRYESDALAYAETAEHVLHACFEYCGEERPSLGLSCQRSSFLIWERPTGKPVTPLISWQDNRGEGACEALRPQERLVRKLTGLRLTPYYFAPKLYIVLQQHPEWREQLLSGELVVGMLDTFLIWRWSRGEHYVTDASMAARTLLMDIHDRQWSPKLCELFGIPISILPQIKSSVGMDLPLNNGLTLQASLGDQSAALVASVGENGRDALVNLGTGGFVARHLGEGRSDLGGYLQTLVYQDAEQHPHFAIEGTLNSIAAALAAYPVNECKLTDLAMQEIFCIAEASGIGAPYFRNDLGLRFSAGIERFAPRQVAALLLEAIIFRVVRMLEEFHRESVIERVYFSGGLSDLDCLLQGIAQCIPFEVYRLRQKEGSLQGAALLASGMTLSCCVGAEKVEVKNEYSLLLEKYQRWKEWLDRLLDASPTSFQN